MRMLNRLIWCLIVPGLTAGLAACDKKERVPLPKTDAGEIRQVAVAAVGVLESAAGESRIDGSRR
jgi:hypothetical protein